MTDTGERTSDGSERDAAGRAGDHRDDDTPATAADLRIASSERVKAFTDAVVAIAMTLLILPLINSVGIAGAAGQTSGDWAANNTGQIIAFLISFVVIASFWVNHHRLFARVHSVSPALLWITVGWMLTIVWLPVPTAMTGLLKSSVLQKELYIGTMVLTTVMLFVARLYLRVHSGLHDIRPEALRSGLVADVATAFMFVVALVVSILVPVIGYSALFLMVLVGPLHALAMRVIGSGGANRSPVAESGSGSD